MKKFLVAALAASTMAFAGPTAEPIVEEVVVPDNSSFYVGAAYGLGTAEISTSIYGIGGSLSEDADQFSVQAGYDYNQYIGVMARYGFGIENDFSDSVDTFAVYVKPQYPITEELSVYGLLGYAWNTPYNNGTEIEVDDFEGFSYGIGGAYKFTENVEAFVDYTSVYSDTFTIVNGLGDLQDIDTDVYSVNFGINYRF